MKQQKPIDRKLLNLYQTIRFAAPRIAVAAAIAGTIVFYGWKIWKEMEVWKREAESAAPKKDREKGNAVLLPDNAIAYPGQYE